MLEAHVRDLFDRLSGGDGIAREELITHFMSEVVKVAKLLMPKYGRHVEFDDLVSYGTIGLIDALERFDPDRGVKFSTYANYRIRGAVIDQLRDLDWVPRNVRLQSQRVRRAKQRLRAALKRNPSDEEVASEIGVSVDEVRRVDDDVERGLVQSFDASDDFSMEYLTDLEDHSVDVEQELREGELRRVISEAANLLDVREQIVVGLHYFGGMTFEEIGVLFDVTGGWVSQIHTRAIEVIGARI